MPVTDPIADFLNRISTAGAVGKEAVLFPHSRLLAAIAEVLSANGFLANVEKKGRKIKKRLSVALTYDGTVPHIKGWRRLSRPSRRVYYGADDIRPVKNGSGVLILSTPQGIMTGTSAREARLGGEALFEIW